MDFFPLFDFVSYVLAEGVVADDVVGFLQVFDLFQCLINALHFNNIELFFHEFKHSFALFLFGVGIDPDDGSSFQLLFAYHSILFC